MTKNHPDSLKLISVEAFMAAAACDNYTAAARLIAADPVTVRRRVNELEEWLHRVLITTGVPFDLTEDGDDFVPVAAKIVELIDEGGLKAEISTTRVQPDGTITIQGHKLGTEETREIGKSLVASRATINPNYTPPARTSGKDVDVLFLTSAPPT